MPTAASDPIAAPTPAPVEAEPLAPSASSAAPASPAAAPPSHPATPTPAARPVTASAPASSARAEIAKPPRPEAQAAGQDFFVQLGSFTLEATARRVADAFTAKGVTVRVVPSHDRDGRMWYTVRTDDFTSADAGTAALHQIEAIGGVQPVLRQRSTPLPTAVASTV
jgi:cell division protein FtsN